MIPTVQSVADAALQLGPEDRRQLVEQLLGSLETPADLHPAWQDEIKRRLAIWRAGSATEWPVDDALACLDRHIQGRRPAA